MSTGEGPPKNRRATEPAVRLPHQDDYYTETGLSWVFQPRNTTPAADHAKPELNVWGWPTKLFDGSGKRVVMVCCALGALGFAPDEIATEILKTVDGANREFGKGFRATNGVSKLSGKVLSNDGKLIVRLSLVLNQRQGEPETVITPEMVEEWDIDHSKLSD